MDPLVLGAIVAVVTVLVLFSGVSVATGLLIVSAGFLVVFDGLRSLELMPEIFFGKLDNFALLSIPMFIIMGAAIASTRAGGDLYEALDRWLTRVPGGLVISNLGACALFAAMSGSSPATCAAIGKMGIPEMRKRGFPDGVAAGSIAAGGTLGILIPPSVTMIVYGIATETSIGRLFLAGVLPGPPARRPLHGLVALSRHLALRAGWRCWRRRSFTLAEKLEILPRVLPFIAHHPRRALCDVWRGRDALRDGGGRRASLHADRVVIYRLWWTLRDLGGAARFDARERDDPLHHRRGRRVLLHALLALHHPVDCGVDRHARREPLVADVGDQHLPADRGLLPAAGRGDPDGGADPAADRHHRRVRPLLVRRGAHDQHGDRADLTRLSASTSTSSTGSRRTFR